MITVHNGILNVEENERFIGFAGDNLNRKIEFLIIGATDVSCIYRLYLTFDDGTVNYFVLDCEKCDQGVKLCWNVESKHIFKSGVVKAQIKAFSHGDVVYHTTSDTFLVGESAEILNTCPREVSEYLEHEENLNRLIDKAREFSVKTPYIGDNGNWYIFDNETESYKDSGFGCTAGSAAIGNGTVTTEKISNAAVTPQKLDRAYMQKKESRIFSFSQLDDLVVQSGEEYIHIIRYSPSLEMFESAPVPATTFVGFANDGDRIQLLDTDTGLIWIYTVGTNTLTRAGQSEEKVAFAGVFNDINSLTRYEFEDNVVYYFTSSGALNQSFGSGECMGRQYSFDDDDGNLYREFNFINFTTGECFQLDLVTGDYILTSGSRIVDNALDENSVNPVRNSVVSKEINKINSVITGLEELLERI